MEFNATTAPILLLPATVGGVVGIPADCLTQEDIELMKMLGDISSNFTVSRCENDNLTEFDTGFETQFTPAVSITLAAIYTTLAVTALAMNIFIVVVIFKNELHRKATYVFIVNLALSDTVMLTFNMPIYLYYIMENDWVFGRALCHIAYPTFSLPVFVSSWTIMLISLDRCIAAKPGAKFGISRFKACMMILAVIVVSLLLSVPLMLYTKLERPQDYLPSFIKDSRALCIEVWPDPKSRTIYGTLILSTQFMLPVIVTIILHAQIYNILEKRLQMTRASLANINGMAKYTNGKSSAEIRARKTYERKKAVGKTLFSIVVVFVICWSPTVIFMLIMDTAPKIVPTDEIGLIHCILKILATSSSCINPIFYGWLNRAFREEAVQLIKTCGGPKCIQQRLRRKLSSASNCNDHESENNTKMDTVTTNVSVGEQRKPSTSNSEMAFGGIRVRLPSIRGFSFSKLLNKSQSNHGLLSQQAKPMLCIEDETGQRTPSPISTKDDMDYRSWENSSLGPFLTPAASPTESDSEQDNETTGLGVEPTLTRKRSVRFKERESTCSANNPTEEHQDIFVSMTMPTNPRQSSKKRRALNCFPSNKEKTTIHYSIIIANNILQNLVVNTNNPAGSASQS